MTDTSHKMRAGALRVLAIDAIENAASGHPGMPLGMADVVTVLFEKHIKFDATDPDFPDRDRFVLSAGHGSMLLYGLLFLLGVPKVTIEALKSFRSVGSPTPGHPEYGCLPGIETTTGPLGQGFANGVGLALAERIMNAKFGDDLVDHHTYVIAGDGCLMEGISQEALALAGHLQLGKLIVLWDDNGISIDGPIALTDSTDQLERFAASGWHVAKIDGHNPSAIDAAITAAKRNDRPSLIACRTVIGYGAPTKSGSASCHGSPLGTEEVAGVREALDWPHAPFEIPSDILDAWRLTGLSGRHAHLEWRARLEALDAEVRGEFHRRLQGEWPPGFAESTAQSKAEGVAASKKEGTRQSSKRALAALSEALPELIGGSADLTSSNLTLVEGMPPLSPQDYSGRYIHYGIREHGMAAVMNGLALHGGVRPYGGTFLAFTDYARPAIRLSAMMRLPVIYVATHDSIGLGEDGPTHQPIEHLASLRAIPGLDVYRPADFSEAFAAYLLALAPEAGPSVLCFSRQAVPPLPHGGEADVAMGVYAVGSAPAEEKVRIFASGTEVSLALEVQEALGAMGIGASVFSSPCLERFFETDRSYQQSVLGGDSRKVAIEAGVRMGWDRLIGTDGLFFGLDGYGASGKSDDLYAHFGLTPSAIADQIARCLHESQPNTTTGKELDDVQDDQ